MLRRSQVIAVFLLLSLACAPANLAAPRAAAPIADPELRELVRLVNAHRARIGCPPLRWSAGVARVAQRHSEDMARRRFFSHTNPDGRDPFERLHRAELDFSAAAENIAAGQTTAREVFSGWLRSRGHRQNIERCLYAEHGIGRADDHWTHVFFTPRRDPPLRRNR